MNYQQLSGDAKIKEYPFYCMLHSFVVVRQFGFICAMEVASKPAMWFSGLHRSDKSSQDHKLFLEHSKQSIHAGTLSEQTQVWGSGLD